MEWLVLNAWSPRQLANSSQHKESKKIKELILTLFTLHGSYLTRKMEHFMEHTYRYRGTAVLALQEAAGAYLVGVYQDSYYLCTIHAKRVTRSHAEGYPAGHEGSRWALLRFGLVFVHSILND